MENEDYFLDRISNVSFVSFLHNFHTISDDIAVLDYLKTIEDREEVLDDFKEICQKTPEHDMCKKHGSHYHCPSNPDDFLEKPFTDDQKAEMLYFTNEKRSLVCLFHFQRNCFTTLAMKQNNILKILLHIKCVRHRLQMERKVKQELQI